MTEDKTAIRNAATVIVVRDRSTTPRVLMGQRGSNAVFMPNKFVFPGGAVDAEDADVPLARMINEPCVSRLEDMSDPALIHSLCVAAIRELFEETGQILGVQGMWQGPVPKLNFCRGGFFRMHQAAVCVSCDYPARSSAPL